MEHVIDGKQVVITAEVIDGLVQARDTARREATEAVARGSQAVADMSAAHAKVLAGMVSADQVDAMVARRSSLVAHAKELGLTVDGLNEEALYKACVKAMGDKSVAVQTAVTALQTVDAAASPATLYAMASKLYQASPQADVSALAAAGGPPCVSGEGARDMSDQALFVRR